MPDDNGAPQDAPVTFPDLGHPGTVEQLPLDEIPRDELFKTSFVSVAPPLPGANRLIDEIRGEADVIRCAPCNTATVFRIWVQPLRPNAPARCFAECENCFRAIEL